MTTALQSKSRRPGRMNADNPLATVYAFKIVATLLAWSAPFLLAPTSWLTQQPFLEGFPEDFVIFLRLLGWAYVALCVGYYRGWQAVHADGTILATPVWVGLVSNGGACLYLLGYGLAGTWNEWHPLLQVVLWSSVVATAGITWGLFLYGAKPLLAAM